MVAKLRNQRFVPTAFILAMSAFIIDQISQRQPSKMFWKYAANLRRTPIPKCDFNKNALRCIYCTFASLKWFGMMIKLTMIKFYRHYLIWKKKFTSSLVRSFERRINKQTIKTIWILREISAFRPFQRYSFQLPSPPKVH